MGFLSGLKKVGKIALKAAPIAAAFIPGVGPLASMAISAGTSGLSKKLEGGSWKDSLLSAGIGGAAGYAGGKIPGIGPSTGTLAKVKDVGAGVLNNVSQSALNSPVQPSAQVQQSIGPSRVPPIDISQGIPRPNLSDAIMRGRRQVNPAYGY